MMPLVLQCSVLLSPIWLSATGWYFVFMLILLINFGGLLSHQQSVYFTQLKYNFKINSDLQLSETLKKKLLRELHFQQAPNMYCIQQRITIIFKM
jgi:hypothetical protein